MMVIDDSARVIPVHLEQFFGREVQAECHDLFIQLHDGFDREQAARNPRPIHHPIERHPR